MKRRNDARSRGKNQGMNWCRKAKRLAIYLRDSMACMWCGNTLEESPLTLDHVIPHSQGGSNEADNLVTCCHKCNSVRRDRPAEEFAVVAAAYLDHGITAEMIMQSIREHLAMPIDREAAKAIMARRPTWHAALKAAAE